MKMAESYSKLKRVENTGKRRNCLLRAISPFPTVFSKGLFPRGVQRFQKACFPGVSKGFIVKTVTSLSIERIFRLILLNLLSEPKPSIVKPRKDMYNVS